MRSPVARWAFVTLTWIALLLAAGFVFQTQKGLSAAISALSLVDLHAREAQDALADLRAAQQAYVASGQGLAFWVPKVTSTMPAANAALAKLREVVTSESARSSVEEAIASLAAFAEVDKRARDYIGAQQALMAGDVIFTEGNQVINTARQYLESARQDEHQAFDARTAASRKQQNLVAGAATLMAALCTLLLGPTAAKRETEARTETIVPPRRTFVDDDDGIVSHARPVPAPPRATNPSVPALKNIADLATDFGRVRDYEELARLLERTAAAIDATGVVVWMGNASGADLRAAAAHGYSTDMLARIPAVSRNADNAAAAAYRTGTLQIVVARPGTATGAIVAPILSADGCVGALSAEMKGGAEGSEAAQATAVIVAAYLANVLSPAPSDNVAEQPRAAQA